MQDSREEVPTNTNTNSNRDGRFSKTAVPVLRFNSNSDNRKVVETKKFESSSSFSSFRNNTKSFGFTKQEVLNQSPLPSTTEEVSRSISVP